MKLKIHHHTWYQYERDIYLTTHLLRFKPAAHYNGQIEKFVLNIAPASYVLHWQQDPFNNYVARVDFTGPVGYLQIDVEIVLEMFDSNPFDFIVDESAQYFPFEYSPDLKQALGPYLDNGDGGVNIVKWLNEVDLSKQEIVSFLTMINEKVYRTLSYNTRMEPGVQSSDITLSKASGSCRDFGWLLVQIFRNLGLATRFVSGYIIQLAGGNTKNGDTVDLHAWAEVYIPGAGWIGLDATSGVLAGPTYIPIACTPNPANAAAVTGTSETVETIFTFNSTLTRLE
jgi:transglutaminase-like putative cysteine protease